MPQIIIAFIIQTFRAILIDLQVKQSFKHTENENMATSDSELKISSY
jgi:hypothetical protein